MTQQTRKMWQFPWRYKESITLVSGIIFVGFLLQVTIGNFNFELFHYPVNLFLALLMIFILLLTSAARKTSFYQWFTGIPLSVTLIAALLVLGLIMGLTPQTAGHVHEPMNLPAVLGFDKMTSSWPFVIVYFMTLMSLGALIIRRLISFRIKDYAFYLNHTGLWLLLFASGLGAPDMKRYVMQVREGEVEWRGYTKDNEVRELPVAIELNDFYMEEYPPQLSVIDRNTGIRQPEEKPDFFSLDMKRPHGELAGWDIQLMEYIHEAVRNSDSTYHEVHMPASSPAAKVAARNQKTGEERSGWICAGNISQLYMVLNLDTNFCIAMMRPEPKRFVSDINIYREDKETIHTLLEVNKPYRIGSWMIYQYGYDEQMGKLSGYSIMELVYDPWLVPVYTGIFMLAAGSVCMLWGGNKRKEDNDDMG